MYIFVYIYMYVYDSQTVHHNPCFNLFILHNNSFDNQGSEVTAHLINLHLPVIALVLEFARN